MSPKADTALLPGAILIADAHYCATRPELLPLLEAIADGKLSPPQLFLVGDISDMLIGPLKYTHEINRPFIVALNRVAQSGVMVFYLEGNHDFLLRDLFVSKVRVVPRSQQPLWLTCNEQSVMILHGDKYVGFLYEIYCRIIRSRLGLWSIHVLTGNFLGNRTLKTMQARLAHKKLCHVLPDFLPKRLEGLQRLAHSADIVLEGHFHQGAWMKNKARHYQNLPAFACGQSFVVVKSDENGVLFQETDWGHS